MLPAQRNKIDLNSLNDEEKKALRMYGKLPSHKDVLGKKLQERKYFDSGDYALSKAGKAAPAEVGTTIARPENIPHNSSSPPTGTIPGLSGSPPTSMSPMSTGSATGFTAANSFGSSAAPEPTPSLSTQEPQVGFHPRQ